MYIFQKYSFYLIIIVLAVFIVIFITFFNDKKQQNEGLPVHFNTQYETPQTPSITQLEPSQTHTFTSASQADTELNCQLQLDQAQRLIVNEQTRDCFEYFISQHGEHNLEKISQNFQLYAQENFKAPAQQQILDLWSRYVDYRAALGSLQFHETAQENAQYFKKVFYAMHDLKQRFFSHPEIDGLFGAEDLYQQYTIDRMEIMENPTLDAASKAKQLQQRFEQLPQDWQDNLAALSQLEDLRTLTAQIKAKNGSAQDIRNMRVNLVGEEATQRLEQLDQQRSNWKQQVESYLDQRKNILDSNMNQTAKDQAIQQLKQQQFQAMEQQRLQTFETIYDQGGTLPFSN